MDSTTVLIVGAGPAGSAAARVLALAGHTVLLIDRAMPAVRIGESLPGAARPLLRDLGLLEALARSLPSPAVGNLSCWGSDALEATDFIRDPNGSGWHLDRCRFDAALREAAVMAGAEWQQTGLQAIRKTAAGWQATLDDGLINARWIIDASGRKSAVARCLGVRRLHDERLVAVYAWGANRCPDGRTLLEAVANGWWYTAALPGNRRVAALHTQPTEAAAIVRRSGDWQAQLLATRHVAAACQTDGQWSTPQVTAAGGSRLELASGEHWLAVGDAAAAFDPLSSQGIFNALYTGLRGAQAVHAALAGDNSPVDRYSMRLADIRAQYRAHLSLYYGQEQRWRSAPFWRVRLDSCVPH